MEGLVGFILGYARFAVEGLVVALFQLQRAQGAVFGGAFDAARWCS